MHLKDLFRPTDLVVGFAPSDKWAAIRELMDHMVSSGRIDAARAPKFLELVLERESSMSTGMERGIAIPHAAVDGLPEVVACIGLVGSTDGLAFEAIDGRPTRLVVLLLIPRAQKLLHIRTLADIARVLGKESVRTALLAATTPKDAWAALAAAEGAAV